MDCPPLVVDLDGTLLRSDLLLESGMAFVRQHPLQLWQPLLWLQRGKAGLKAALAAATELDVRQLPYDHELLQRIEAERQRGRRIILATASHQSLAQQVADHLQLFDEVLASDGDCNLSAGRKRDLLVSRFGARGFDYAGNSKADLPVWAAAREAWVVNPEPGVEARARQLGNVTLLLRSLPAASREWPRALRLHQWLKNMLIFVPLLAGHQLADPAMLLNGLLALLFFSLCASSVYLLNDLLDLADDRQHPSKQRRPFAAGRLPILHGVLAAPLLLLTAFAGSALLLPGAFVLCLAVYYLLTLAYSLYLKRQMALDVIVLALLYTLRIIAGCAAFQMVLTSWLLAFSMFIFLSLALVKRYAELRTARHRGDSGQTRGRGYYPDDLEMVASLGAAAGYLSVMVLALYIQDHSTMILYRHPQLIWLACPLLLFWISRVWMLTHRGRMHDDPVIFAITDRTSQIVGLLFGLVFWVAA